MLFRSTDVLNPVTTDVYGNPLCTEYVTDASGNTVLDGDGAPIPLTFANGGASGSLMVGTESSCVSDHYGDIVIPNLGPNRYAATVVAPDPRTHGGDQWIQTTTLEGGHDWDMWQQEGETGYDTELLVGGERVTPVAHGFVKLTHNDQVWTDAEAAAANGNNALEQAYYDASAGFDAGSTPGTGVLKGRIREGHAFIASGGGLEMAGTNLANAKDYGPITDGIVSIACIATCSAPTDQVVWTGRARAADGSFEVTGLQSGDYTIALWDETQSFILATVQYHVESGQTTDMGDNLLYGWFTMLSGSVFNDLNGDGVRDPGEPGVPGFGLTIRTRSNSLQDQGASKATTNEAGEWDLGQAYPLNQFLILEAYNPRFKNTGYTYQADNDPSAHTIQTSQVDFNFLPVFGNSVTIDIGVQAYGTGSDYWSGTGAAPPTRTAASWAPSPTTSPVTNSTPPMRPKRTTSLVFPAFRCSCGRPARPTACTPTHIPAAEHFSNGVFLPMVTSACVQTLRAAATLSPTPPKPASPSTTKIGRAHV